MKAISLTLICPKEIIWFLPDNFYSIFHHISHIGFKKISSFKCYRAYNFRNQERYNKKKSRLVLKKNKAAFL